MTQTEFDFLEDQRGPRKMFCENVVDSQWLKTAERRAKDEQQFRRREARAKAEARKMDKVELTDDMVDEVFQTLCTNGDDDIDYVPDEPEEEN